MHVHSKCGSGLVYDLITGHIPYCSCRVHAVEAETSESKKIHDVVADRY